MYKLLIVDDEPLVQIGLKSMLNYGEMNISIVGVAKDGQTAVEMIRQHAPDIVMLDIKMPVYDGMEVMERVAKTTSAPPVYIILTSYEDFEYARSALRHGAHNYLLKIELSSEILHRALTEAIAELNKRRHFSALESGEDALPMRFPIVDNFFIRLLNNWFTGPKEIEEMMADLKIDFSGACYTAICFDLMEKDQKGSKQVLASTMQYMLAIMQDVCGQFAKSFVIRWSFCSFAVTLALTEPPRWEDEDTPALNCVRHVQNMVYKYQNEHLLAAIGPVVQSVSDLPGSFMLSAALVKRCTGERAVLVHDRMAASQPQGKALDVPALQDDLAAAIGSYDTKKVEEIFTRIMDTAAGPGAQLEQAVAACASLVHVLIVSYGDWGRMLPNIFGEGHETYYDLYYDLHMLKTLTQVREWLAAFQKGLCDFIQEDFKRNHHWLVPSIKKYIEEHYSAPLSLNEVARAFDISSGYISTVFRKYNDKGFSECVTQAKIRHAKEMLLKPDVTIHEVSEKLGYSDPYYFSKVFKRITGISPKDYLHRSITR